MKYIDELEPFYFEELRKGPFPLDECKELTEEEHVLVTTYLADIAGFASWGTRLTSFSDERKEKAKSYTAESLFERHPALKVKITAASTPKLFKKFQLTEAAREFIHSVLREPWPLRGKFVRPT